MTAKKKAAAKKATTRRSRARANADTSPPAPTCPTCSRPLQEHEQLEDGKPCQRCQFEAMYPGRNLDDDQAGARAAGVRLTTYVRDAIHNDGSVERERRAGLRAH